MVLLLPLGLSDTAVAMIMMILIYRGWMVQGAVEWRKEIADAIRGCSKFVAFVDYQYLLSFNCLEVMMPADQIIPTRQIVVYGCCLPNTIT